MFSRRQIGFGDVTKSVLTMLLVSITGLARASVGTWSGTVPATAGPSSSTPVPLYVEKSELISVSVSGSIKIGSAAPWSGPVGTLYYGFQNHLPPSGYTHGILMLKIGGNHIPIEGGARTLDAPFEGPVSLYVNDDDNSDNLGSFSASISIGPPIIGDADDDGLDDRLEDELLDAWAPEFLFDSKEDIFSLDVYPYLRNCFLTNSLLGGDTILSYAQTPFYPEWFLEQINGSGQSTNYLDFPSKTTVYANVRDPFRYQRDPDRLAIAKNIGIYGHVVPKGSNEIVVEYWLFFGHNDMNLPLDEGDHEGDWELYKVSLDRGVAEYNLSSMIKAEWHGHGEILATWRRDGGWDELFSYPPPLNTQLLGPLPTMPQFHAPLFIEENTHGLWPAYVAFPFVGRNAGDGISYTPNSIPNIGEAYRPRLGMEVIAQFNGLWGGFEDSPEGPVPRAAYLWQPSPSANNEALYIGSWSIPPITGLRFGRISRPWHSLQEFLHSNPEADTVIIYPGTYNTIPRISRRLRIEAPHGHVTITR